MTRDENDGGAERGQQKQEKRELLHRIAQSKQPMTSTTDSDWPSSKLYNPWTDEDSHCFIQYNEERKLLQVVDEAKEILHVFNPLDIIGVDVEIKLFEAQECTGDPFCNAAVTSGRTSPVNNNEDECCNIFDAVSDDKDAVFNITDNNLLAVDSQASAILNIYCYPKIIQKPGYLWGKCNAKTNPCPAVDHEEGTGHRTANHLTFSVAPAHDFENLTALVKSIRRVAQLQSGNSSSSRTKCMVLINPKSGMGHAPKFWSQTVQPMLEQEAGMDCSTVVTTEAANHAKEYMEQCEDILSYDAVICLGGDGLIHEILQGWQARTDNAEILQKIKLGVLGCGTGNGLAKSLTYEAEEEEGVLENAFLIARGKALKMDLSRYQTSLGNTYTSFLTFTWAMIADIDINSEIARCLGHIRIDMWGVFCVASLTRYKGRLSYLPPRSDSKQVPTTLPPLDEPLPGDDWKVIEDDFLLLWASHVSHASGPTHNSPPSSLQDGVFQIMVVRGKKVGRASMANILLSLDSGGHAGHPMVEFLECVAYRLEPLSKGSHNDLDGELIESGPIQATIMPAALQVFANSTKEEEDKN